MREYAASGPSAHRKAEVYHTVALKFSLDGDPNQKVGFWV
jgi:hypothetical protein